MKKEEKKILICPCCKYSDKEGAFTYAEVRVVGADFRIEALGHSYKEAVVCPKCGVLFIPVVKEQ